ncbi:LysR family transcriptional regulator [Anopheles sinensis]|uniref:LysR family transcriptional regulator n=1 Tax=Anopheles sinensis TaxID=74873 RepID=A0A084WBP8_ANOSI|nr:LysR family transcriptional regulator [Anopheles sinensis]
MTSHCAGLARKRRNEMPCGGVALELKNRHPIGPTSTGRDVISISRNAVGRKRFGKAHETSEV